MNIDSAFKLFDVRGKYPEVVDERLAFALAHAISSIYKPKIVAVSMDTRESSPSLKEFLTNGFSLANVQVVDLGETPLPTFNFALATGNFDLGVMVTASHIAEDENGFKIIKKGATPLDEQEVNALKTLTQTYQNEPIVVAHLKPRKENFSEKYLERILALAGREKPDIKLTLDVSRSVVVTSIMVIVQEIHADFHLVNSSRGGNPLLPQNRKQLERDVVTTQSDLGIIWDSDGDRVVFVDRRGKLIPLSFTLGILASAALAQSQDKKVAVDVRAGLVVRDLVREAEGILEIFPAWNTYLKFAMKADPEIVFAGETSGHFLYRDFYGIDDGILAALRFVRLFEKGDVEKKLMELTKRYFELPEQNIPCSPEKSPQVLARLTEKYRESDNLVSIKDGLTVFGPDWKFNLRESVTEPLLRLNLEARSETQAKKIYTEIYESIHRQL
jgi:phosphomannomutase